jgi:hypothetical protein
MLLQGDIGLMGNITPELWPQGDSGLTGDIEFFKGDVGLFDDLSWMCWMDLLEGSRVSVFPQDNTLPILRFFGGDVGDGHSSSSLSSTWDKDFPGYVPGLNTFSPPKSAVVEHGMYIGASCIALTSTVSDIADMDISPSERILPNAMDVSPSDRSLPNDFGDTDRPPPSEPSELILPNLSGE